jgi:hypothetical protein
LTREAIRRREATNLADVAEDLRGENLADPKDGRERRAACGDGTRSLAKGKRRRFCQVAKSSSP